MKTKEGNLFRVKPEEYGQCYREHLFEQYKLYVKSAEKISDRRQNANNYFIAINTALISFLGLSFQAKFLEKMVWVKCILALLGIVICVIFWFLLRSYKQLNTGKFKVIHEIEKTLPLSLYEHEWEILREGQDKNVYFPFSHIELYIPRIFGVIYFLLGIVFILQLFQ